MAPRHVSSRRVRAAVAVALSLAASGALGLAPRVAAADDGAGALRPVAPEPAAPGPAARPAPRPLERRSSVGLYTGLVILATGLVQIPIGAAVFATASCPDIVFAAKRPSVPSVVGGGCDEAGQQIAGATVIGTGIGAAIAAVPLIVWGARKRPAALEEPEVDLALDRATLRWRF